MFDGSQTPARPQDAATEAPDHAPDDVARLCDIYDPLLEGSGDLEPERIDELSAMARIYDLDADRAPADVWSDLRTVLLRQAGPAMTKHADTPSLAIMVVEDDLSAAADLVELLDEAGHRVIGPFHSAETAEAAAAHHAIDAALLDINLSGEKDGVELARILKDRWGAPVLFLSGDVTAAARNADLAEALVLKPYKGQQVLDAIALAVSPKSADGESSRAQGDVSA